MFKTRFYIQNIKTITSNLIINEKLFRCRVKIFFFFFGLFKNVIVYYVEMNIITMFAKTFLAKLDLEIYFLIFHFRNT